MDQLWALSLKFLRPRFRQKIFFNAHSLYFFYAFLS